MKIGKKILSVALILVMIFSVVPLSGMSFEASAASGVQSKLDSFISSYPSGSRWTGSFDGGTQCYGFAKMVIYNLFGKNSSGGYRSWNYAGVSTSGMNVIGSITSYSSNNVKSLLSNAKCGDVLQFNTTKQHSMIVYSVDSTGVVIYDCNWVSNCGIRKEHVSFGAWSGRNSSKLTLLRANNYNDVDNAGASFVTAIDQGLSDGQTFDKVKTSSFTVAGWAFRSNNELTRVYYNFDNNGYTQLNPINRDDVVRVHGNSQLDCGFNQSIDISGLSVGSHTFRLWCSSNGADQTLLQVGITITTSDNTKPTISNIAVRNSPTGYLITCNVSDNNGVTRVRFPTWTVNNGQDDLVWHEGNLNSDGKSAWYQVCISDHNYERGVYCTHIYAYDSSGNETNCGVEVFVPEQMIQFHAITSPSNGDLGINISGTPKVSGQVKLWFKEYDIDTNYYIDIFVDGKKVISNGASDDNGYISYVVDTTTMSNGTHTITADLYDTTTKYTTSKNFDVVNSHCTVTFQPYSESGASTKTVVVSGTYGTLPTPTRKGYVFDGWYTAATGGSKVTSSTRVTNSSNHVLYAHWSTQTLYFNNNDGVTGVNFYRPNNCFDVSTQTLTINGTYSDDAIIDYIPFSATAGDVYKITVTVVSGTVVSDGTPVLEGYDAEDRGMSYSEYGGTRVKVDFGVSTSAIWTITAKQAAGLSLLKIWVWGRNDQSVTFNNYKVKIKIEKVSSSSASATAYTPAAQSIKKGSTYGTLPTPTRTGYTFDGWYTAATGGTKVTSSTTVTTSGNQTLYAHWTCNHSTTEIKNSKSASCTAEGYTGDTYCKTCSTKIKTGTSIAKLSHSYTSTVTTQPTCSREGVKTYKCSCGDTYTESIAVIAHDQKITVSAVAATCTQDGFTEGKRCSMCGTTTVEQVKISATGHSDSDSDDYCDVCGYDLDPQAHCSCSCHKSGLAKFFFTIINFFQKLFGSNKVCSCGAKH